MKIKVKSKEQLAEEGFMFHYPMCYTGNKKDPDAKFKNHWLDAFIGKEVNLLGVDDYDRGTVKIEINDVFFEHVPLWLLEKSLDITKLSKPKTKKFSWAHRDIKYYEGFRFKFPCEMEDLSLKQAKELATWILKVAK